MGRQVAGPSQCAGIPQANGFGGSEKRFRLARPALMMDGGENSRPVRDGERLAGDLVMIGRELCGGENGF